MLDRLLNLILTHECPDCYCRLVYQNQLHNCPEAIDEKDESFEDQFDLDTVMQRYHDGDIDFFLKLLQGN